jgi:glycosyltransferase involved in cell wall biosynthesis
MPMIKFSIIIPSYNQSVYLKNCLNNILQQNYNNYEIIIIDGGSEDNSIEIIKSFKKKFNKITYWESKKDFGQADAINKGIKKCSGDWITWQNCDDYFFSNNVLKIFADYIGRYLNKKLFIGNINLVNKNKKFIREIKYVKPNLTSLVYEGMVLTNQAAFWKREIHTKIGYLENTRLDFDYEWFMRILYNYPKNAFHINEILGCYRIHENQKTSKKNTLDFVIKMNFRFKYGYKAQFLWQKLFLLKIRRFFLYILQGNFFYAFRGFLSQFYKKIDK